MSDAAKALADRIAGETEWNPSVAILRDHILRQFTERLDAVCEKHPDRMQHAMAVIIQAGPGRSVLVLSDPATEDTVKELRRHADAGAASPLTELLKARLPI